MNYSAWKRLIDLLGGALGALAVFILLPFAAFFIAIEDGFPVFVRLERLSGGKTIRVWKFRTMERGAHSKKRHLMGMNERADGPLFKMKRDPRVTKTGKILRKFRLDEFPQFLNVLAGDMALVGPRPHEPEEVEKYPPEFKKIADAKAGITGLSQVSGASALPFLKELELDFDYLKRVNFKTDAKIIRKTITILFTDPTGI
ncbi:hypothetical protein A3I34_01265 [Candidatus Jorgensenbacteria bacterium RIFCSPLOWO2_02_FULL_45_12]|uniref:Bacterial sugar transferase domain-containing protein n=2 Tax=Candidatus Joergenseniibacteriota TaxID=1752739 RepID=A0A1F6BPV1_9BACT|nr:MAG: Exopolysaccharide biosynthesis polyprenyl glycosylphosphotransferase [Candidatus Jorgensenbacteria bacterium GW2011_GWA2_45_9]OGG38964.1 MAG: hypothetical protein A3D55_03055 [Candidatus Jorgensenbacteria bacterium RIFCSPHIGHO2_02_FULL_45_20]OGG42723.1 MAG: hypothetical protein A3I34_01265 [Candidatus Jorgensenbacteria bacterium RIFCSPLOWO2_02_FULL_45_12]